MKKLAGLLYAGLFLPVFLLIRILTVVLKAVRFKTIVKLAHRAARLKNRVLYLRPFFRNAGYHYRTQKDRCLERQRLPCASEVRF